MKEESRYKLLKCNFNDTCNAGLLLEDRNAILFSNLASITVSENSISLDPGFNGSISLVSNNIKQPLSKQSFIIEDYLLGSLNPTSRKQFDLPILDEFDSYIGFTVVLGSLLYK